MGKQHFLLKVTLETVSVVSSVTGSSWPLAVCHSSVYVEGKQKWEPAEGNVFLVSEQ